MTGLYKSCNARNPKIQNMLRMVGYGENIGSGFPLILDAWKQAGWETPELINKVELDEVELVMPLPNVTKDVTKDVTNDVVKDVVKELTERQTVIIKLIQENPTLSASEMSQKTGMTTRTIQRDLADLQKKGILVREGGRKDGRWVVITQ